MPLDPDDILKLQGWNFLKDYKKHRELLALAQIAYEFTEFLLATHSRRVKPTPDDCEKLYKAILIGSDTFRGMLARKEHLLPSFYQSMCLALARYVLHHDWGEIEP